MFCCPRSLTTWIHQNQLICTPRTKNSNSSSYKCRKSLFFKLKISIKRWQYCNLTDIKFSQKVVLRKQLIHFKLPKEIYNFLKAKKNVNDILVFLKPARIA